MHAPTAREPVKCSSAELGTSTGPESAEKMGEDNVVEFMIFALCFLFLIMFLDITPFIQAANPSYAIQPTGCTPIAPGELFPLPTRNFYAVTQEFTDLSEHQD